MKKLQLFIFLIGMQLQLFAAEPPSSLALQQIHEAFIMRNTAPVPQEVIARTPPPPQAEEPSPQPNARMIWISGYWKWVRENRDFEWVCGLWRLPPPGRLWSPGYWAKVQEGWTWVKGAWLPNPSTNLVLSPTPPPEPQNEDTGNIPGSNYFWAPGYWSYEAPKMWFANFVNSAENFKWLGGSWQPFNPDWIFEPVQWIWRPEGYLLVSSYWDWTLDARAVLQDCKSGRILEPKVIVQQLTFSYPDFLPEIGYYYHFHVDIWEGCGCTPIWWGWNDWWSLPWSSQWWLWWWWLNPGFAAPPFITIEFIDLIPPPLPGFINIFDLFPMPIFITPRGVPTIGQWIDAIIDALGENNIPFFPPDNTILIDTVDDLFPQNPLKDPPAGKTKGKQPKKPVSPNQIPPSEIGEVPHTPTDKKPVNPPPTHPSEPIIQPPTYPEPPHTAPIPTVPTDSAPTTIIYPPSTPEVIYTPAEPEVIYTPPTTIIDGGGYYGGYQGSYYGGGYSGGYYGGSYYGGHGGGYYGGGHGGHKGGYHGGGHKGGGHGGHGGYVGGGGHQGGGGHRGGALRGSGYGGHGGGHGGGGNRGGGHRGGGGHKGRKHLTAHVETQESIGAANTSSPMGVGQSHSQAPAARTVEKESIR